MEGREERRGGQEGRGSRRGTSLRRGATAGQDASGGAGRAGGGFSEYMEGLVKWTEGLGGPNNDGEGTGADDFFRLPLCPLQTSKMASRPVVHVRSLEGESTSTLPLRTSSLHRAGPPKFRF